MATATCSTSERFPGAEPSRRATAALPAAQRRGAPTEVVDLTEQIGHRLVGRLARWPTGDVEHLAGPDPDGRLIVAWTSPGKGWQAVDVTEKTGRHVGAPVVAWQVGNEEHLAAPDANDNLVDFSWSPAHDWQVESVVGQRVSGPLVTWQDTDVRHLAGTSPDQALIDFQWSQERGWKWQSVAREIAGGLTSWRAPDGAVHLAANTVGGGLVVLTANGRPFEEDHVGDRVGRRTVGGYCSWVTGDVEHVADSDGGGKLIVFWRSPRTDWRVVDVTAITGQEVSFDAPTVHQVDEDGQNVEVLATTSPELGLALHWWRPDRDWQVLDLSEVTGEAVDHPPVGWVTSDGDGPSEHLAAADPTGRVLLFEGMDQPRQLTDALAEPFGQMRRRYGVRHKVLLILWDPGKEGIDRPSKQDVEDAVFGSTDSVRDYFLENSDGHYTIEPAGVVGWYESDHDPDEYWPGGGEVGRDSGAEAIRKAAEDFDFAAFDADDDENLDASELGILFVLPGTGDGGGLVRVVGDDFVPRGEAEGIEVDGVKITWIAEVSIGDPPGPGIVAHELSHLLLGHGDLYFTFFNHAAPGEYSLMDHDGEAPHLDPFGKLKFGWLHPKVILRSGRYELADVETDHAVWALVDPSHGTDEYFLVENRWPGQGYDSHLPDRGLAVWHVMEEPEIYDPALAPENVSIDRWCGVGGLRRALRMVRPILTPPFDDSRALWDGSDPATGYDLLSEDPDPDHAELRWGDGSPSGFSLRSISSAGPVMAADVEVDLERPRPALHARMVEWELPDEFVAGTTARLRIEMRNTGIETWDPQEVHLASLGTGVWGADEVAIGGTVPPHSTIRFEFDVTVPDPGHYGLRYRMRQGDEPFGEATPRHCLEVVAPEPSEPAEPAECEDLRREKQQLQGRIASLQESLGKFPGDKGAIIEQIAEAKADLAGVEARMSQLGC